MPKKMITVEGYECIRCGHKWVPRMKDTEPIICPGCKSPYWDMPKKRKK